MSLNMLEEGKVLTETFLGNYRAIVIDNNDEKKAGRVQVRVHPMMDTIQNTQVLPWALPATPIGGGNSDIGEIFVPTIGSVVWVFFEEGDPMKPVYFASSISRKNDESLLPKLAQEIEDESITNKDSNRVLGVPAADGSSWNEPEAPYAAEYPNDNVIKTESGHLIELDNTPGAERVNIYHKEGSYIEINSAGDIHIHSQGKEYTIVKDEKKEYVNNKLDITAGGDIGIRSEGAQVLLKSLLIKLQNNQTAPVDSLVKQTIIPLINAFITIFNAHTHPISVPSTPFAGSTLITLTPGTSITADLTTVTQVVKGE